MPMRLSEVALSDRVRRDGDFAAIGLPSSRSPGLLTFAVNAFYLRQALANPRVTCIVTTDELVDSVPQALGLAVASNPRDAFYEIHEAVLNRRAAPAPGGIGVDCQIHPSAIISSSARIGDRVRIGEFAVIRENVTIGDDVVIEAGVKVGVDGILHRMVDGLRCLIPHGGSVQIDRGVVLMTNAVVVRAVFPGVATVIGRGSIVGLNSVVGHDAQVLDHCVISNNCVIARGSNVGPDAYLGTGTIVREFTTMGTGARALAGSVVVNDVPDAETVSGNFAYSHVRRMRSQRSQSQEGRA